MPLSIDVDTLLLMLRHAAMLALMSMPRCYYFDADAMIRLTP